MIKTRVGNLFESKAQTHVNTVNCVDVMGKGIALEFKKRYPRMFEDYVARCESGDVQLGKPYLFKRLTEPWILNFPTKDHWRSVSKLSDIVEGLGHLKMHYREWGIVSLAVPPLGCGQGKLDWSIIGPTLYRHLSELEIPVEVYAPFGTSPDQLEESYLSRGADSSSRSSAAIDAPSIAIVDILARIESERHSRPIGRTSFQKLAYFATEAGIPTELDFVKGSYGPFSEQLKPLLTKLVNNGLIEEEKLGNMFAVKVGPTFEDSSKKHTTDLHKWSELENKVVDLFLRLSTRTAEVAATVAFVAKQLHVGDSKPSEMDVLDGVLDWKQRRKPPLEKYEVASAIRNLAALDWIDVTASSDLPVEDEFSAEEDVALV